LYRYTRNEFLEVTTKHHASRYVGLCIQKKLKNYSLGFFFMCLALPNSKTPQDHLNPYLREKKVGVIIFVSSLLETGFYANNGGWNMQFLGGKSKFTIVSIGLSEVKKGRYMQFHMQYAKIRALVMICGSNSAMYVKCTYTWLETIRYPVFLWLILWTNKQKNTKIKQEPD